jgi:hypothetical protein
MPSKWINPKPPSHHRPEYEKLVPKYWNWLLDKEEIVDNPIYSFDGEGGEEVFFMRAEYDYVNRWENSLDGSFPTITRKNIPINRVGGGEYTFVTGRNIFLPVIDTIVTDLLKDASGMPLTPKLMDEILGTENSDVQEKIKHGRIRSMIRRLDNGKESYDDLVSDLETYMFPQIKDENRPFSLSIPEDSKLAGHLEFEFPRGSKPLEARAQGVYVIFEIKEPGRYQIRSAAEGMRGYASNMNYQIQIKSG